MGLSNVLRALVRLLAGNPERKIMTLKNLEPADVADLLNKNEIVLVDVREPAEYANAHIKGAELVPLSQFDPHTLPGLGQKRIVLHCGVGGRSARTVAACQAAGIAVDSHMKGGIQAWMAAGLPVER